MEEATECFVVAVDKGSNDVLSVLCSALVFGNICAARL